MATAVLDSRRVPPKMVVLMVYDKPVAIVPQNRSIMEVVHALAHAYGVHESCIISCLPEDLEIVMVEEDM